MKENIQNILLSRTDSIGDVILSLPMAGVLRQLYPKSKILFLGQSYTQPIVNACEHVDEFHNWDEVKESNSKDQTSFLESLGADVIVHVYPKSEIAHAAKRAGIRKRIGTMNRWYHWLTCNKLRRLSRKKSPLHEAQLNLQLLKPLGAKILYGKEEIQERYGLKLKPLEPHLEMRLSSDKFNLILHPTSKGSAMEWGVENFVQLIKTLPRERYDLFITGTEKEGERIRDALDFEPGVVHDMTGKMTLDELIGFIARADGLLAASTGPLHMAAALGIHAIGLYPSRRPMHPGRWAPLGRKALVIEDGIHTHYNGPLKIEPERIKQILLSLDRMPSQ